MGVGQLAGGGGVVGDVIDGDRAGGVLVERPLDDVEVVRAPVGDHAAGVVDFFQFRFFSPGRGG